MKNSDLGWPARQVPVNFVFAVTLMLWTFSTPSQAQTFTVLSNFTGASGAYPYGAPDLKIDVESTNSVLNPYRGLIEFSVMIASGPHRKTRPEAEADTVLKPFLSARYRNVYDITADGNATLSDREFYTGLPSPHWENRVAWPDACWDTISSSLDSREK